jgi:galactose mutarotase-like enzyme
MYTIENETLKVVVRTKGAELDSIYHKTKQLEYLWSGDPAFWGKKSPVLFPIVGALKQETFYYQGKKFHLSRHGFAREMEFTLTRQSAGTLEFTLQSNEATLAQFPFPFRFDITYTLIKNQLEVMYTVTNTGNEDMYFSVGAHPAFKIPLVAGTGYEDYSLLFNYKENARRWPISKDGLIIYGRCAGI